MTMTQLTSAASSPVAHRGPLAALVARPWVRIAGGVAVFLVASVSASSDDGIVLCPFRRCTGGYCPGCGLTRSGGKLVRGDVVGAWHHHPFLLIGLAQLALIGTLWASGSRLWSAVEQRLGTLLLANVAVLVAIWLLRMALGDLPAPFVS